MNVLNPLWWSDDPVGLLHLFGAVVALIVGPMIFFRQKGDARHRVLGWTYVVAMLLANGLALTMYKLTSGPNLFHFFAVVSLASITPGVLLARRARQTGKRHLFIGHYYFMSWSYFGLFAAFVSQLVTQLVVRDVDLPGELSMFAWVGIGTGVMAGVSAILINRHARAVEQRFAPTVDPSA